MGTIGMRSGPRLAYEIFADFAGRYRPEDRWADPGKLWDDCTVLEQHDILEALSGQARDANRKMLAYHGPGLIQLIVPPRDQLCSEADAALRELLSLEPQSWKVPECRHCRRILASALCLMQLESFAALGFSQQMMIRAATECAAAAANPPVRMVPAYIPDQPPAPGQLYPSPPTPAEGFDRPAL